MNPSIEVEDSRNSKAETLGSFRILGIGGAGCEALGCLQQILLDDPVPDASLVAINSDVQALALSSVSRQCQIGARVTRGLGAGGDPEQGRAAAEQDAAAIREWVQDARVVFLITSLGGGVGSGAAPVIARIARESGALVLAIAALPFEFEGEMRAQNAEAAMRLLRQDSDAVLSVPNEILLQTSAEDTTMVDLFLSANRLLAEGVLGLLRLLTQPGLIRLDFAHLEKQLKGRRAHSTFAAVRACGEKRAQEALDALKSNPFLNGGTALTEADAVLICVAGGKDLRIQEVDWLLEQVQQLCQCRDVVVGTSVQPSLDGQLMMTVVASSHPEESSGTEGRPHGVNGSSGSNLRRAPDFSAEASAPLVNLLSKARTIPEEDNPFVPMKRGPRENPLIPPPPDLSPTDKQAWLKRHGGGLLRKPPIQTVMKFEVVSKGRFEKTEATLIDGENLDLPTYMRKGISLN